MSHTIELLYATPLSVVEKAINTCWDKHSTCNVGEVNKEKLIRVIRKFKHRSTAEHGRFIFNYDLKDSVFPNILDILKNNKYFIVKHVRDEIYTVSTNLRAIIEIDIPYAMKIHMVSEEYRFLVGEEHEYV